MCVCMKKSEGEIVPKRNPHRQIHVRKCLASFQTTYLVAFGFMYKLGMWNIEAKFTVIQIDLYYKCIDTYMVFAVGCTITAKKRLKMALILTG